MPGNGDPGGPVRFFGVGRDARIAAMRACDDLRARGIAAAALFRPQFGWIVQVYPGGIRRRDTDLGGPGGGGD